jgi:hypothetical protein
VPRMRPPLLVGKSCSPSATAACCLATGGVGPSGISIYRHRFGLCWKGIRDAQGAVYDNASCRFIGGLTCRKNCCCTDRASRAPNDCPSWAFNRTSILRYITVDIIRTATTIDIMRTAYTDMVIGIIIEQERHYIRSSVGSGWYRQVVCEGLREDKNPVEVRRPVPNKPPFAALA